MSEKESKPNYRITCPYCKADFLTKSYSKHLISEHIQAIFQNKENADSLLKASKTKKPKQYGWVDLTIKGRDYHFMPCCEAFYTKSSTAKSHMKESCEKTFVSKAEELLERIKGTGIVINTGDNTIINLTVQDNSGVLIDVIKRMTTKIDGCDEARARYYKKLQKLKNAISVFKERHAEDDDIIDEINELYPDSDISSVKSVYGEEDDERFMNSDDEKYTERFDATRVFTGAKFFKGCKIDLSRDALKLSTLQESMENRKAKADDKKEEEDYEKDQERLRKEVEAEAVARANRKTLMVLFDKRMSSKEVLGETSTYIKLFGKDEAYKVCMRE